MKKKKALTVVAIIVFVLLIIPMPAWYRDGGTRSFTAILYRVVIWNQMEDAYGNRQTGTEIHLIPNNFRPVDFRHRE